MQDLCGQAERSFGEGGRWGLHCRPRAAWQGSETFSTEQARSRHKASRHRASWASWKLKTTLTPGTQTMFLPPRQHLAAHTMMNLDGSVATVAPAPAPTRYRPRAEFEAAPEGAEYAEDAGAEGEGFGRGRRANKARVIYVDGHPVLKQNM